MKTILTALREEDKVVDETAGTIARALGGTTIAAAISPAAEGDATPADSETSANSETPSGNPE